MSMTISFDTSSLNSLMDELEGAVDEAVRPAAQAAADVLYKAVKNNVQALGKKTGNLDRSIYQAFSQDKSTPGKASYDVSWNHKKAPHGHLIEFGHLQRYRYYRGNDGQIRPMVRPGMEGRKPPGRRASRAEKDAYYVALPTPIQVPAKSFVRNAASRFPEALAAAEAELLKRINQK